MHEAIEKSGMRKATSEESRAYWDRLHATAIKPNAVALATIMADGDVAVLLHNANAHWWRAFGRKPRVIGTGVVRMKQADAERLAAAIERDYPHDGAIQWLRKRKVGRLFVAIDEGSWCLDHTPDGFITAPNTRDEEWMS